MELITDPKKLKSTFKKCFKWCDKFYAATAWASRIDGIFDDFFAEKDKIKMMVVGIHFYQTDPIFIRAFLNSSRVKFIELPDGTFHPKVYLFKKGKKCRAIVGSANFTNAAFSKNSEANVYLDKDYCTKEFITQILDLVKTSFKEATIFNEKRLLQYERFCEKYRKRLSKVSGTYNEDFDDDDDLGKIKPVYDMESVNLTWNEFFERVKNEYEDDEFGPWYERRLNVLKYSQKLFEKEECFSKLSLEERKFIAGLGSNLYSQAGLPKKEDSKFFGSMGPAREFTQLIHKNDHLISSALDYIPLKGKITQDNFNMFVETILKHDKGIALGTATRLLAMKRPDFFVCVDSKNEDKLREDFGIKNKNYFSNRDKKLCFMRYWFQILGRIHDSIWWKSEPSESASNSEKLVWEYRTAFVDCLFYEE